MSVKERRKSLGWTREELARRAALDKQVVQLIELDQWTESGALGRIQYVLAEAEHGNRDVQLPPIQADGSDPIFGVGPTH
jgi:transcriptional regulator with XRE-family HTH domain